LGILAGEGLKLLVSLNGLLDGGNLCAGNVAGAVSSVLMGLQLIEGAGSACLNNRKLAALHGLDLGDLLKDVRQ
jgi:hypothetical protein